MWCLNVTTINLHPRRAARQCVLKALFAYQFSNNERLLKWIPNLFPCSHSLNCLMGISGRVTFETWSYFWRKENFKMKLEVVASLCFMLGPFVGANDELDPFQSQRISRLRQKVWHRQGKWQLSFVLRGYYRNHILTRVLWFLNNNRAAQIIYHVNLPNRWGLRLPSLFSCLSRNLSSMKKLLNLSTREMRVIE